MDCSHCCSWATVVPSGSGLRLGPMKDISETVEFFIPNLGLDVQPYIAARIQSKEYTTSGATNGPLWCSPATCAPVPAHNPPSHFPAETLARDASRELPPSLAAQVQAGAFPRKE